MLEAYARLHPEHAQSHAFRDNLKTALTGLADAGAITLPKSMHEWDRSGDGDLTLPHYVRKKPQTSSVPDEASAPAEPVYWLPVLARAHEIKRTDTRSRLALLNKYLINHPQALEDVVPYREMALEVYGDEKALDGSIRDGKLFGVFSIETLGMCDPEPPLPREDFPCRGKPLLLVENHHTYWSLLRWNKKHLQYASIAYGSGNVIRKSAKPVKEAKDRSEASHVEYLGDLDPMGIIIAHGLNVKMQEFCGEQAIPAETLYLNMLTTRHRRPLTEEKKQEVGPALAWLTPSLAERAKALFDTGFWISQEALRLPR
jgi:hypothetical protein